MRLYDNPWITLAYLFGKGLQGTKDQLQNAIDERDKDKSLKSAISYLSSDEEERVRRIEIAEKRKKWAARCFLTAWLEPIILLILMLFLPDLQLDLPPVFALIIIVAIMSPMIFSIIYGFWYSLSGKYL